MGQALKKSTGLHSTALTQQNKDNQFSNFQQNARGLSTIQFPSVDETSQFLAVAQSHLINNSDVASAQRVSTICESLNELVGDPNVQEAIASTDAFQSLQEMFISEQPRQIDQFRATFSIEGPRTNFFHFGFKYKFFTTHIFVF